MLSKLKIYISVPGFVLCTLFSMCAAGQGGSAGNAAPVGTKIGVVAIQDAVLNTNEGKKEFDALQARFGPRNNELKSQGEELDKLKASLQAQQDKLSDEARNAQIRTISEKQKAWQRRAEDFQGEVQQAEQEIISRLGQKMLKVLEKYALANGYAVVLDVSNPQTTPVMYAQPSVVITSQLVEAYNAENPISGAPAASAPKPAAPARPAATAPTPKKPQ